MRGKLEEQIRQCTECPRLRRHCEKVAKEKRRAYLNNDYWGLPVSPFGPDSARLLVVGLAPAAHGANRTGRIFTGDRSGDWLYRALHRAGFANQARSVSRDDGLVLIDSVVSCIVKCAPPDNKPLPEEIQTCTNRHLSRELDHFGQIEVCVALGGLAWKTLWKLFDEPGSIPPFAHGRRHECVGPRKGTLLLASYHPSQQNTFTGRLTEPMLDGIFSAARERLQFGAGEPGETRADSNWRASRKS